MGKWWELAVVQGGADPRGYIWHGRDPDLAMPIALPTRRLAEIQHLAGMVDENGKPFIDLHGLRHSRASHLLLAGVPLLEVSRFLGHTSQLITAETYAHLVPDQEFSKIRALLSKGPIPADLSAIHP